MGRSLNKNLEKVLKNLKQFFWTNLSFRIGIRHIGQENAKIIGSFFTTIKEFTKLFEPDPRKKF